MDKTYTVMIEGHRLAEKSTLALAQKWIAENVQKLPIDTRKAIQIVEQQRA